jgi:hypothetical protein
MLYKALARAGVLLALSVLVASGVFECGQRIYGRLGPAFNVLRTNLLTLLLMALCRAGASLGLDPVERGRLPAPT